MIAIQLSRDELYLLVKGFFRNDIRSFIDEVECFDIIENLLYAFGDVMSMFLLEDTEDRGFSSPLNKKFLEERDYLLRPSFLTSNGLFSDRYCTLYEKQLKLLKKQVIILISWGKSSQIIAFRENLGGEKIQYNLMKTSLKKRSGSYVINVLSRI